MALIPITIDSLLIDFLCVAAGLIFFYITGKYIIEEYRAFHHNKRNNNE